MRIRSYGILSTRNRPTKLARSRELLKVPAPKTTDKHWKELLEKLTGHSVHQCPKCKAGAMQLVSKIPSTRELEKQAGPGQYDPRLQVSRAQAACWLTRLDRIRLTRSFNTS